VNREEIAWAAGLFEGEGSVYVNRIRKYRYLCVEVNMTDEDIVQRLHRLFPYGTVRQAEALRQHWKRSWHWRVHGFAGSQAFIALIWPWLGERRRATAAELLKSFRGPVSQLAEEPVSKAAKRLGSNPSGPTILYNRRGS
jgi:hypothetical protein